MGISAFDVVKANAFIGSMFTKQGQDFYVQPYYGDGNGRNVRGGVKTLAAALALCTANKNDTVNMLAGHDTAAYTTDYLSSTLDWNKNLTHLCGCPPGSIISPRARIAFVSTYDTASNLFTVSASDCIFENLQWYAGVAGTNPTGCLKVTGSRNAFRNCHIAGIGHDNNDIADAYSLYVSGSENLFQHCVIGLDTISRGTADNAELVLAGGARNVFEDCLFVTFGAVNTHQFVKRATGGSDRFTLFKRCTFMNYDVAAGGGATLLEAFDVTAGGTLSGKIFLHDCAAFGVAEWEASSGVSTIVQTNSPAASAADGGVGVAVTGA